MEKPGVDRQIDQTASQSTEATMAQPLIAAVLADDIDAFRAAYQQNPNGDVFDYMLDRVPDRISVAMALAIRRLLPEDQANDTLISSSLVNGRIDVLDALLADGWLPNDEFIGAHIIILNDAACEESLDRQIVDAAYWLIERGFVRVTDLSERFGLGEVRN